MASTTDMSNLRGSIRGVELQLAVVLLALVLLPGYICWRLVRSTTQPGRIRRRLTVVLPVLPLAADALNRVLPEEVATPLERVASWESTWPVHLVNTVGRWSAAAAWPPAPSTGA
jgi:hypothetical protein